MTIGIVYIAVNVLNDKVYVGQTRRGLRERSSQHLIAKKGNHFANALAKHGASAFVWSHIDSASSQDELDKKERHWISFYGSLDRRNGYNTAGGGFVREFTVEETKRKIATTLAGHSVGEETRKKISQKLMGRPTGRHTPVPPEIREKIRATLLGRQPSEKAKLGASRRWKGAKRGPQSEEHRRHASESRIQSENMRRKKVVNLDTGVVYEGVRIAATACGTYTSAIALCCRGVLKQTGGFRWAYFQAGGVVRPDGASVSVSPASEPASTPPSASVTPTPLHPNRISASTTAARIATIPKMILSVVVSETFMGWLLR